MRRGRGWSCWKNASATTRRRSQSRSQTPPHRKRKWTRTRTRKRVGSSTSSGSSRRGKALRCDDRRDDVNDGPEGTTTMTRRRGKVKKERGREKITDQGARGRATKGSLIDSTLRRLRARLLASSRFASYRLVSSRHVSTPGRREVIQQPNHEHHPPD
jgi:hypothetical protein